MATKITQAVICGIYKITSPTNRVYVGQSHDIKERFRHYNSYACKDQKRLYNSLKKHGVSNHVFEIVQILPNDIDQNCLNNFEMFVWLQFKEANHEMLNIKEPGSNGKHSEASKQKMREIQLNRKYTVSEETKQKIREARKKQSPVIFSEKVKKEIGDRMKKRWEEIKSDPLKYEEVKKINSSSKKGKKLSIEHKLNISKGKKGQNLSADHKRKLSEAAKKQWERYKANKNNF